MTKVAGVLNGKRVHEHELTSAILCNVAYVPVRMDVWRVGHESRCDYCGRTNERGHECKSCGALL